MSDHYSGNAALNWRGPLLAAGIFALMFAILLLMAYQNESNTSDMGSSFREDPYGTSLLFNSLERAGHVVKRSQDEDFLSDEDPSRTTAFLVGGDAPGDWKMEKGKLRIGQKLRRRIEDFLTRGGRVVLIAPTTRFDSQSQGWRVEDEWSRKPQKRGPIWIPPDARALPAGRESMYIDGAGPWLNIDDGWSTLYAESEDGKDTDSSPHVYMAIRKVAKGELIAASQESFLLNEAIKIHPNPALLDFLAGARPVVWVDETLHGLHQDQGVLWLVRRYRLQTALALFWTTVLVLLWSMRGDLVRRPPAGVRGQVIHYGEGAGLASRRLLQRSIPIGQVVAECWEEFRRRSPRDAQAIAADPQTGPRLRTALAQPPVAGYKELSRLIAERRASARELTRGANDLGGRTSPQNNSEEVRSV